MGKQQKQQAKSKSSLNNKTENNSFITIENWFEKNDKKLFYSFSVLCLLFSILHFNARISEGGDDSAYIYAGYKYIHDFPNYYFSFNAPLYPMFLSLPIAIFGLKLIVLKSFSVVFTFLHFFFMYKAFRGRIPNLVFYPVMFFICVNAFLQYFASQTYNEAFFLCFQGLYFFLFVKLYDALQEHGNDFKKTYKLWLAIGLIGFILTLTRNIAIPAIPAAILFFIVIKQYKSALYYSISFGLFKILFEIIKFFVWGNINQYSGQGSILLFKDPYNKSKGYEDISGFVGRFFDNCTLYMSKRFFQILGFMDEESIVANGLLAFIIIAIIVYGLFLVFKKQNRLLLFASLHIAAIVFATFVVLQTRWDQTRMILIYIPIILMLIHYAFYFILQKSGTSRGIAIIIMLLISFSVLISSIKRANKNFSILSKNLKGDIYYGYTPDWVNYLKMSEWCGKNLPDTAFVACRKAPMSFIYSHGKEFYAVYSVQGLDSLTGKVNPDSVLAILKRNKVTHVLLANLRRDPRKADRTIINTLHNMMAPVAQKYPQKFKLVHTEGQIETAELYEITTK